MIICDKHFKITHGRRTVKATFMVRDSQPGQSPRACCDDHLLDEVAEVRKRHAPGTVDVTVTVLSQR